LRCSRCGNENSEQNRFCGMCGASLLATPAAKPAEPQPVSVAATPTATRVVAEPAQEPPRPAVERSSSISGPSFLGLNDPAPGRGGPRKRASLSIDPHSAPGSNLDYLLDEEEPRHHWGIGKILLILIAFGLAAGFGYLRFKNQGLAWLNPSKKPSAAQNSTAPDTTTTPPPSLSSTPDSQPSPQPSAAAPPQPTTAAPSNPPGSGSAATPAPATPAPSTPAPSDTAKPSDASPDATSDKAAAPADSDKAASSTDKDSSPAKDTTPDNPPAASKPVEKPKPAPKAPAPKPSAASRPVAAYDAVAEAQKYLYGRGAPQDCDRGLRLLRPAANQAQPKAMIEMGALYSAGLCTPHDLPTAYRWFAMALRKDPENTAVQADLQKLWGEMTQPERQLAIKLTQ
jgi:zinc ribbon protein/Sel1 repeat-containing protein